MATTSTNKPRASAKPLPSLEDMLKQHAQDLATERKALATSIRTAENKIAANNTRIAEIDAAMAQIPTEYQIAPATATPSGRNVVKKPLSAQPLTSTAVKVAKQAWGIRSAVIWGFIGFVVGLVVAALVGWVVGFIPILVPFQWIIQIAVVIAGIAIGASKGKPKTEEKSIITATP